VLLVVFAGEKEEVVVLYEAIVVLLIFGARERAV